VAGIGVSMLRIAEPATSQSTVTAVQSGSSPARLLEKLRSFFHLCRTDYFFQVLCAVFFLYVGVENAVGGWVASYAKSLKNAPSALAVMTPSFFYAALMLGRWLAPLFLRTIEDFKLARAGVLLACLGIGGLVSTSTLAGIMVSASVTGLGLSSVYPITIALLSRQFGAAASRVGSTMFVMANLGGACLPWFVGYCSTLFGAVRAGLVAPLVAAALMLALYFAKWKPYAIEPKNNLNLDAV
jgi:MFS transporter, FHS family, glucose/mannose:H+ symporter